MVWVLGHTSFSLCLSVGGVVRHTSFRSVAVWSLLGVVLGVVLASFSVWWSVV